MKKRTLKKYINTPSNYKISAKYEPGKIIYYMALDNQRNEFTFLVRESFEERFSVNISVDELIKSKGINPTVISRLIRKKRSAESE